MEELDNRRNQEIPQKRKRNFPCMPDPDAEVIALSPGALLATNRFVCEVCGKGFQRDQNLQLHRRGHNLPWKLRQRTTTEVRKRVYVCPEVTCVHHNPSRALGDLTGIKKHFSRKHGEKKWKCERCSKKYAVQSDWKAHMKTCGTKEYKCACGTIFSRRDSFTTHRAFCDALEEENTRALQTLGVNIKEKTTEECNDVDGGIVASPPPPPLTPSATVVSPDLSMHSSEFQEMNQLALPPPPPKAETTTANALISTTNTTVFAGLFASSTSIPTIEPTSLTLSSSLFPPQDHINHPNPHQRHPHPHPHHSHHHYLTHQPTMSATALLQKAAQMGAAVSNESYLLGFGLSTSSSSTSTSTTNNHQDNVTTLDFLGLGMNSAGVGHSSGLSALLNSFGGYRRAGTETDTSRYDYEWGGPPGDIKPK